MMIRLIILIAFLINSLGPMPVFAGVGTQNLGSLRLPAPGVRVHLSPEFTPAHLSGLVIHPEDALKFDFLIDQGDEPFNENQKRQEYQKLIKYFLASLTVPDENQWVNLSPFEKDRIIKDDFGKTEMGRDLLSQDYLLKQITASLIYPQDELGKKFWDKVYERAYKEYGTTNIPVNTFNKVWIVPDEAAVYESGNTVYVLRNHLKVMLEQDYLALTHSVIASPAARNDMTALGSQIIKEIILPELEREINEGQNFANLRQIYSGMILAAWYKRTLKESLLTKIYADKNKIKGIALPTRGHVSEGAVSPSVLPSKRALNVKTPQGNDLNDVEFIYQQYLQAFKKGVFNYIKEDLDKYTKQQIPRKYFSGGTEGFDRALIAAYGPKTGKIVPSQMKLSPDRVKRIEIVTTALDKSDAAMTTPGAPRAAVEGKTILSPVELQQQFGDIFAATLKDWEVLPNANFMDMNDDQLQEIVVSFIKKLEEISPVPLEQFETLTRKLIDAEQVSDYAYRYCRPFKRPFDTQDFILILQRLHTLSLQNIASYGIKIDLLGKTLRLDQVIEMSLYSFASLEGIFEEVGLAGEDWQTLPSHKYTAAYLREGRFEEVLQQINGQDMNKVLPQIKAIMEHFQTSTIATQKQRVLDLLRGYFENKLYERGDTPQTKTKMLNHFKSMFMRDVLIILRALQTIKNYPATKDLKVQKVIARGADGVVFLARTSQGERKIVKLNILLKQPRFADLASRVRKIVKFTNVQENFVHNDKVINLKIKYKEVQGVVVEINEFIDGPLLTQVMIKGVSVDERLAIIRDFVRIHKVFLDHGFINHDMVNLDNILMDMGAAKFVDFGHVLPSNERDMYDNKKLFLTTMVRLITDRTFSHLADEWETAQQVFSAMPDKNSTLEQVWGILKNANGMPLSELFNNLDQALGADPAILSSIPDDLAHFNLENDQEIYGPYQGSLHMDTYTHYIGAWSLEIISPQSFSEEFVSKIYTALRKEAEVDQKTNQPRPLNLREFEEFLNGMNDLSVDKAKVEEVMDILILSAADIDDTEQISSLINLFNRFLIDHDVEYLMDFAGKIRKNLEILEKVLLAKGLVFTVRPEYSSIGVVVSLQKIIAVKLVQTGMGKVEVLVTKNLHEIPDHTVSGIYLGWSPLNMPYVIVTTFAYEEAPSSKPGHKQELVFQDKISELFERYRQKTFKGTPQDRQRQKFLATLAHETEHEIVRRKTKDVSKFNILHIDEEEALCRLAELIQSENPRYIITKGLAQAGRSSNKYGWSFLKHLTGQAANVETEEEKFSSQQKEAILNILERWDMELSDEQIRQEARRSYAFMNEIIRQRVVDHLQGDRISFFRQAIAASPAQDAAMSSFREKLDEITKLLESMQGIVRALLANFEEPNLERQALRQLLADKIREKKQAMTVEKMRTLGIEKAEEWFAKTDELQKALMENMNYQQETIRPEVKRIREELTLQLLTSFGFLQTIGRITKSSTTQEKEEFEAKLTVVLEDLRKLHERTKEYERLMQINEQTIEHNIRLIQEALKVLGELDVPPLSGSTETDADSAMKGGIDLNSNNLNLQIKRNGKGIPLPFAQQDIVQLNQIQGLVPVILEIKPAVNLPIFSELQISLVPGS